MILVLNTKFIDLSKFDGVRVHECLLSTEYIVKAFRHNDSSVSVEDIASFKTKKSAMLLVSEIAIRMANNAKFFDVDEWAKDFCGKDYC